METGTIKKVHERGFGFICTDDGRDVFFHCSSLQGGLIFSEQLMELRVMFDVKKTERGLQAVDIRPAL